MKWLKWLMGLPKRQYDKMIDRINQLIDRIVNAFAGMTFKNVRFGLDRPKYDEFAWLRFEFTWHQGFGFGAALGKYDFWTGWPRDWSLVK